MPRVVGGALKAMRVMEGLSQPQVAERLNIIPQLVSNLERGGVDAPLETANRIARLFGKRVRVVIEDARGNELPPPVPDRGVKVVESPHDLIRELLTLRSELGISRERADRLAALPSHASYNLESGQFADRMGRLQAAFMALGVRLTFALERVDQPLPSEGSE